MAHEGAPVGGTPVRLGLVGPAHGIRGDVVVHPDADLVDLVEPGRVCWRAHGEALEIAEVRQHKQRTLVRFVGIEDRTAAEALRGTVLELDPAEIEPDEDTLWVEGLVGAAVVDDAGTAVGAVQRVDDGPGHDWLVVASDDGEAMVPLVDELVDVDMEAGRITVHALPGLLDDDWM